MYNDQSVVNDNVFENNSVGAFLMYSADVTINNNIFAYNRGPSGYGLALKDMDEIVADGNFFVGNRAGLYLDNSPSVYEGFNIFSNNVFAYNDIGATSLPAVERNIFTGNSFLDNAQQVSMRGREVVSRNLWHYQGQGNFWSDYAGYDKDGDGIGEIPYKSDKLFESLSDKYPVIQFFTYSPVTQAIEFTGSAFPILRPHPKLIDEAPMMAYEFPAWLESDQDEVSASMIGLSAALLMVGVVLVGVAWTNTGKTAKSSGNTLAWTIKADPQTTEKAATNARGSQMIHVQGLTKRYGKHPVLEEVSFTIQKGESVALWGTNGAGKTTTLQCLLGVIPFQGTIEVNGVNVGKDGKQARHNIGYIPQEAIFYDLTVWKTIEFYARIKRANTSQLWEALERVGLKDHAEKSVKALSGGMKQRLALAISLLGDPPLLLLDEPTANLDAQARYEFLQLVQSLNQDGKTVVFSTHRLDEVRTLATRVIVLRDQGIFADCHPDMLTQQAALQQWLRVWIPQPQWETALHLLQNQGFSANPNGQAIYVQVGQKGKMAPLRVLETAQIAVQDFDLIDNNTAIIDSIGITTAEEVQS
jgi:ABC-type multidrug transport system ATPase subunit